MSLMTEAEKLEIKRRIGASFHLILRTATIRLIL